MHAQKRNKNNQNINNSLKTNKKKQRIQNRTTLYNNRKSIHRTFNKSPGDTLNACPSFSLSLERQDSNSGFLIKGKKESSLTKKTHELLKTANPISNFVGFTSIYAGKKTFQTPILVVKRKKALQAQNLLPASFCIIPIPLHTTYK